jgi:ribonuclease toxin BrnT of type II toxin-antitoxin system
MVRHERDQTGRACLALRPINIHTFVWASSGTMQRTAPMPPSTVFRWTSSISASKGRCCPGRNDRGNEERWLAIGSLEGLVVAFAYAKRGTNIRIISARRANRNERERSIEVTRSRGR